MADKAKKKTVTRKSSASARGSNAKPPPPDPTPAEPAEPEILVDNIVLDCALRGDPYRLAKCFDDPQDVYHETVESLVNGRCEKDRKTPLDWAALLGRDFVVTELIKRGADVNAVSGNGYCSMHLAAAWGQVACLKALIANGADPELKTMDEERPREIAERYKQFECLRFLDWYDAKQALVNCVNAAKDQMAAGDKAKSVTKEEKTTVTNLITQNLDWIEKSSAEATASDIISRRKQFEEATAPIFEKFPEPADNKKISHKKVDR